MENESNPLKEDGLYLPKVRWWSKEKHTLLARYLDMFSVSMRDKWSQRFYIDLFSGAGKALIVDRDNNPKEIIETSSLIAAKIKYPFTDYIFCEKNRKMASALENRLRSLDPVPRYKLFTGDANEYIHEIVNQIPLSGSLNLAFIDPFGLHLDFSTVQELSSRRVDLIVLLADNMDAKRNWDIYEADPKSNLDRFFCASCDWRAELRSAGTRFPSEFRTLYESCLSSIGYTHFGHKRVQNSKGINIYTLLFASKNKLGLSFWNKALAVDAKGQRGLFPE